MAGGKNRAKVKKIFSPPPTTSPVQEPNAADDDELMDDLLAQLDSKDKSVQKESANVLQEISVNNGTSIDSSTTSVDSGSSGNKLYKSSKDRHRARQARKAEELVAAQAPVDADADARLEKEAKEEERDIKRVCDELNLEMHEINPDGHCLYAAIADQLSLLNIIPPADATYQTTRNKASKYIFNHPDDFLPFLPSVTGEDGAGASTAGLMGPREFETYCATIRDTGVWGGEPEILALSRAYGVPIHVVQSGKPPVVMHEPVGGPDANHLKDRKVVRISYHRRMYGLGEHYNSLRPKSGISRITSPIRQLLQEKH